MIHSGAYLTNGVTYKAICGHPFGTGHTWMHERGDFRYPVDCPFCLEILDCKSISEKQMLLQKFELTRETIEMKLVVQDLLDRTQHYLDDAIFGFH